LASLGYPVVGDATYGAPRQIRGAAEAMSLQRNFLHAAELELRHPRTGENIGLKSELPEQLRAFLAKLIGD
jgi:23S rRNA-/tRNA-specific pseudouridylate synthase